MTDHRIHCDQCHTPIDPGNAIFCLQFAEADAEGRIIFSAHEGDHTITPLQELIDECRFQSYEFCSIHHLVFFATQHLVRPDQPEGTTAEFKHNVPKPQQVWVIACPNGHGLWSTITDEGVVPDLETTQCPTCHANLVHADDLSRMPPPSKQT